MAAAIETQRIRSGSHGELWLNGELASETYGFKAVIKKKKESVPRCGAFFEGHKVMSAEITGSMSLYNATSRLIALQSGDLQQGRDTRCTLISNLDDPDAVGAQRIQLTGVSFDDLTLADWEAAKMGSIEAPFTADGYVVLEA